MSDLTKDGTPTMTNITWPSTVFSIQQSKERHLGLTSGKFTEWKRQSQKAMYSLYNYWNKILEREQISGHQGLRMGEEKGVSIKG